MARTEASLHELIVGSTHQTREEDFACLRELGGGEKMHTELEATTAKPRREHGAWLQRYATTALRLATITRATAIHFYQLCGCRERLMASSVCTRG